MPLTQLQARDQYILNSVGSFLNRNVKTPYDAEVAAYTGPTLNISKTLKIMLGKPSDSALYLNPPSIGIEDMNAGNAPEYPEIGSSTAWRPMNIALYCYPAVNAVDGQPSDAAAMLLKAYLRDALATVSFKTVDFSNPSFNDPSNILYCGEPIWLVKATTPMNRGKNNPNANERNRFDINVSLKYSVIETLVS